MDGVGAAQGFDEAGLRRVSLADRFDVSVDSVLLSGVQALIRLTLMQKARDAARGWRTAGYVTGYRGSPLGGVDMTAWRAAQELAAAEVVFEPGLNEDLAVTAIWGAQQAHLRETGRYDGVFSLFYAKGPGVDRSGDALRHANLAGVGPRGGALVAMGDDHTCESSTTCHQSDIALMDAQIPVLHPAGPQEILDYGLIGWGLSRFTGCWVGLKCVKDTVEATTVVDGALHRIALTTPEVPTPPEGMSIILGETPHAQEARLVNWRLPAVAPYARANRLDRRVIGKPGARLGVAASGKSWLDVLQALSILGVDRAEAERLGLGAYKIGLAWPLDPVALGEFAAGLRKLLVVEEKRAFIETQAKEALYAKPDRPEIVGKRDSVGAALLPATMDLDPQRIALAIGREILAMAPNESAIAERVRRLEALTATAPAPEIAERLPYFCSGCPHNSSTKIPEGSRGGAGIGCHYMVQWMDRETIGFTHMGGEGANWIGEAKFSAQKHIFQNIGDGTYNHSGLMAIRAAANSGVNVTYKILYNDAVAMTGGQSNDGGLTPYKVAREVLAAGAKRLAVVVDPKETLDLRQFPREAMIRPRDQLDAVQRELREIPGLTVLLYVQTCAAEKRRRRKRGAFAQAPARVMINELVCEGCGDCGKTSNCVSITPLETEFGRKRAIDQSSCNMDFSCTDGFCPSFVTVTGATPRKRAAAHGAISTAGLPAPRLPELGAHGHNILVTGVGGAGVVTIGAILGMAAHLEGKGVGVMEMAGLAQKGGAVHIHCRIARRPDEVTSVRVAAGEADAVIGGDLVVSGGRKTLAAMTPGRCGAVVNLHETVTGAFTRAPDFSLPGRRLRKAIEARLGDGPARFLDATRLAERLLGDAVYANMLLLGAAWQTGLVPLGEAALRRAIELNGASVAPNLRAFEIGRWAAARPDEAAALLDPPTAPETLDTMIERRAAFLEAYQDRAWAERYRDAANAARRAGDAVAPGADAFARAAAQSLFRLMAYKDEYEVARLHAEHTARMVEERFEGVRGLRFHLAPPLLTRKGKAGKRRKLAFGGWMLPVFRLLRHGKALRGGLIDPFGWTLERRMERALIECFEADLREISRRLTRGRLDLAVEIAALPQSIRGYGHVKEAAAADAASRRAALMAQFRAPDATPEPARLAAE